MLTRSCSKNARKNGHTRYYPADSYIALWYSTLLTAVPNPDEHFGEAVYNRFINYFNGVILSDFYKEMCAYWLNKNINSISTEYIDTEDSSYQNIKIGNVVFDFAYEKKRSVYAYYDTGVNNSLTQSLWKEIEKSLLKTDRFTKMNISSAPRTVCRTAIGL